ncbi:MAG TPA: M1 family metallopeptidase [Candidatus Saccharimonadales bacterium]|nr:M1 family metallopeptidase [Candidatus Saccharimonadales bacterium]
MSKKVPRLFAQFQPENYKLHLNPDRESMTFSGTVEIRGKKVGRPSKRITLHQKGLKINSAKIVKHYKKGDQLLEIVRTNNQKSFDEMRLHTKDMIYPGFYTVIIEFSGIITKPMHGIYPSYFKHNGKNKVLISSQFESHHAREGFPCVDEPEAKATFDLSLTTPLGETVLANTPVKTQERVSGVGKRGAKSAEPETRNPKPLVETTFDTTPRMSTYLLAFVFGELGFSEAQTKAGVTVRAYATPENVKFTRYGLDVAVRALDFFSDYFDIAYPLKKLDMVALPDFSAGAMENWGLVIYRETTMLADDKTTSIESKQLVALVIAHELSHQWFGNLVTMKWWDDLWLNESFANLMEYRAVDELFPQWHIWEQFVAIEMASAKRRDSLADVQAIRVKVNHPDEISTIFDPSIVYAKGGSVLYMLMNLVGEEAFRTGLKLYFKKHAYGNTEAKDLWEALSTAGKQDMVKFMDGWLSRPGYPLVIADYQPGSIELKLSQQRFLSDPNAQVVSSEPWQVPLAASLELSDKLLTKQTASLRTKGSGLLLLNHDGHSYFVPKYQNNEHRSQVVQAIQEGEVSSTDRLLLIDNYNLMQRGGQAATTELLELVVAYSSETSETVWGSLALALSEVRRLVESDPSEEHLDILVGKIVMPVVELLGWEDKPEDSSQSLRLRSLALSIAAGAKVPSVIDEALKRFRAFEKPSDLAGSIRSVVYFIGARYGTDADFKKLLALHNQSTSADEKEELAAGLTSVKKANQIKQLIDLLTTDEIRHQDVMHWFVWLLRNRYGRQAAWQWLTSHWGWIEEHFSSDKSYSNFARYSGSIFSHPTELEKFKAFFEPKKSVVALARDITLAEQEIMSRIAWRQRNEHAVKTWLNKH